MKFQYAIALTGGIGSGKSTASSLLKLYGYQIIDADSIAHKVLEDSSTEVICLFGEGILEEGKINRKALGAIVFANSQAKKQLEALLHPKIKEEIYKQAQKLESQKMPYFIDIPLFYETRNYPISEVLLLYVPKEIQIQRLIKREGLTKEAANQRILAQIPLEDKKQWASYVIDNSGSLENLQKELEEYLKNYLTKRKF